MKGSFLMILSSVTCSMTLYFMYTGVFVILCTNICIVVSCYSYMRILMTVLCELTSMVTIVGILHWLSRN